jgi:PAS domain S-box-containing protein
MGSFTVETADSAQQAREKIAAKDYDAIVSDYQMPGMDGIEFLRALRVSGNSTPFIFFTGKGREEVVIQAFESGADFYIQKGGEPKAQFAELAHKIQTVVRLNLDKKALLESEEILRFIVRHDPNAIAVYDTNLHYIAVSDRYLKDYGVKEEDIIGKHHYAVFPEMPQKWKDVHQRCMAGAIEHNDDDFFERPDGSITYNRWECRPWFKADGTIGGIVTYTEVTTERKLAEEVIVQSSTRRRFRSPGRDHDQRIRFRAVH